MSAAHKSSNKQSAFMDDTDDNDDKRNKAQNNLMHSYRWYTPQEVLLLLFDIMNIHLYTLG